MLAIATIRALSLKVEKSGARFVLAMVAALSFVFFIYSAIRQRVEPNWPAPAYIPAIVLLAMLGVPSPAQAAGAQTAALRLEALGERLLFPKEFVGRGDMSRGGLLLRAAQSGIELDYEPLKGAVRHGKRPPKLQRP